MLNHKEPRMKILEKIFGWSRTNRSKSELQSEDCGISVKKISNNPDGITVVDFKVPSKKTFKIIIYDDEFNGDKIVEFKEVASRIYNKLMTSGDSYDLIYLDFGFKNINGQDKIFFSTYQKTIKFKKGDKIAFLFQDKEVKEFELVENGYRINKDFEGVIIESYALINKSILEKFSTIRTEKWRFIPCDERRFETCTFYTILQNDLLEMTRTYNYVLKNLL